MAVQLFAIASDKDGPIAQIAIDVQGYRQALDEVEGALEPYGPVVGYRCRKGFTLEAINVDNRVITRESLDSDTERLDIARGRQKEWGPGNRWTIKVNQA